MRTSAHFRSRRLLALALRMLSFSLSHSRTQSKSAATSVVQTCNRHRDESSARAAFGAALHQHPRSNLKRLNTVAYRPESLRSLAAVCIRCLLLAVHRGGFCTVIVALAVAASEASACAALVAHAPAQCAARVHPVCCWLDRGNCSPASRAAWSLRVHRRASGHGRSRHCPRSWITLSHILTIARDNPLTDRGRVLACLVPRASVPAPRASLHAAPSPTQRSHAQRLPHRTACRQCLLPRASVHPVRAARV